MLIAMFSFNVLGLCLYCRGSERLRYWNAASYSCIQTLIIITSEMNLIVFSANVFQAIFEKKIDLMHLKGLKKKLIRLIQIRTEFHCRGILFDEMSIYKNIY
jgi:p-aminobenzoyl-glutamate transporter AbgT